MSDLAPFVAATLRDKVVADMQEELRELNARLDASQLVQVTGPEGHPIYARSLFSKGNYDNNPELWKVEFPTVATKDSASQNLQCTLSNLPEIEIRIGGICKARLSNGNLVEGFVNDIKNNYDHQNQRGAVSVWFGGPSGIWLNILIQPIDLQQYSSLRDFDLSGDGLYNTLCQFLDPETTIVHFSDASFLISLVNGAMELWGISTNNSDDEEEKATMAPNDS